MFSDGMVQEVDSQVRKDERKKGGVAVRKRFGLGRKR